MKRTIPWGFFAFIFLSLFPFGLTAAANSGSHAVVFVEESEDPARNAAPDEKTFTLQSNLDHRQDCTRPRLEDGIAGDRSGCYQCHTFLSPGNTGSIQTFSSYGTDFSSWGPRRSAWPANHMVFAGRSGGRAPSSVRPAPRQRFAVRQDGSSRQIAVAQADSVVYGSQPAELNVEAVPDGDEGEPVSIDSRIRTPPGAQTSSGVVGSGQQVYWNQAYMAFWQQNGFHPDFDSLLSSHTNGGYRQMPSSYYTTVETFTNPSPTILSNYVSPFWGLHDPEPIVTIYQPYFTDSLFLGEVFTFDYRSVADSPTDIISPAVLRLSGTLWNQRLREDLPINEAGSSDWQTVSIVVPESMVGTRAQIYFALIEGYPLMQPEVYLRNISSTSAPTSVSKPVPEPATILLLSVGLLVISGMGRSKDK